MPMVKPVLRWLPLFLSVYLLAEWLIETLAE